MSQRSLALGLIPEGLTIDRVVNEPGQITVLTHAASWASACPTCGFLSRRLHSRYRRSISDLPAHGRTVTIEVMVRRFAAPP